MRPISWPGCLFWVAGTLPRPRSTTSSISSRPLPFSVAMCSSGLCTSTPAGGAMSAAVTSPGPCLRRYMVTGSSESELTTRPLRLRMISVTSSLTPGTVVNSCRVPSIRMLVTAAPGIDDRRVRRGELLLGVELDDQLLLDRGVDHLAGRDAVDQHAQLAADDLQPRRHGALAGAGLGDLEGQHPPRLLGDLDDVVGADPVRRDVDLAAVDPDVTVAHQLAGHVAGLGEAGPVHDVVQARLEDLQQDLTGLARLLVGLFVVAAELLLQDAVDAARLLLLAQLQQVLAVLAAAPAVLARRVGPDLDRALRGLALAALEEQLHLLAPAHAAVGSGVTGHVRYSSSVSSVAGQTRRRFFGRQPLCGCGVTSWI